VSKAQQDSWAGKADMPSARLGLATCAVNGKIYAIGGYTRANAPGLRTVEEYDPATNSWRERAEMPTGRRHLTASTVNGKCYAIGGHTGPAAPGIVTVEEYDPTADSWRSRADMPTGRQGHAAAVVDGKVFVVGGGLGPDSLVSTLAVYDPVTNSWTTKSDMPMVRGGFPAASTVNGKIYVIGGSQGSTDVEEYDPATDSWSSKTSMPTGRYTLTASAVNGRIYAIGGKSSPGDTPLATVQEYDPMQNTWVTRASLPDVRVSLASSAVNGKIYALGGSRTHRTPHPGLATNEEYTPPLAVPQIVRRCFFDAETLGPVSNVRVTPRNGSQVFLGASDCSGNVPYDFVTIDAPGYRKRRTHAINGKNMQLRSALPGENGLYFGLFPENSAFTDLVDSGRTTGKKKKRGFLQGLPYMKFEIVRPSDFPMPTAEIRRAAKKELRKRGKFKKPRFSFGDSITMEDQILLRHVPGEEPSVDCTILEDGVCWGPVVSFDAVAGGRRIWLEEGLRTIFYRGKSLVFGSSVKSFYRGFQASVVGQRLKGGKEVDVIPDSVF
jgi:N-acetylneuraminic acid mutarotase